LSGLLTPDESNAAIATCSFAGDQMDTMPQAAHIPQAARAVVSRDNPVTPPDASTQLMNKWNMPSTSSMPAGSTREPVVKLHAHRAEKYQSIRQIKK
jgi:hypothetical protein